LVARKIHPLGEKPCQICGRVLSLGYVYPNKGCPYHKNPLEPCDKENCPYFKERGKCGHLGPGAMGDAPDRFDGFHTYNRCCRSKEDTGRHADNLKKYGEDRRVYEFWVEGDWKTASWLMKLFNKHKISPDHIGPISLGFCHRPKFEPMTKTENIAKGNRMTYEDVQSLIEDERKGEQVVSWHSSFIWNKIKHHVKNGSDAEYLSKLMRGNLHRTLIIFSIIHDSGYDDFLIKHFLHPEYALYQPDFIDFDPKTGMCSKITVKKVNRTEHLRNAKRYIRKSFEALEKYKLKDNRRVSDELGEEVGEKIEVVIDYLSKKDEDKAKKLLGEIFEVMANTSLKEFLSAQQLSADK
jgi:Alw26I/Eco31I/Esp3I family type II restriction endonuclease